MPNCNCKNYGYKINFEFKHSRELADYERTKMKIFFNLIDRSEFILEKDYNSCKNCYKFWFWLVFEDDLILSFEK